MLIKIWTEYEEYTFDSFLSDVGGLMGLMLGLSIYGMTEMTLDFLQIALKYGNKYV